MTNPFQPLAVLDTDDVNIVRTAHRYALEVPAAHFNLDSAETKLKINLISVVASDATFA